MKRVIIPFLMVLLVSCNSNDHTKNKAQLLETVNKLKTQFRVAVQTKDSALYANIYATDAYLLAPKDSIVQGREKIGKINADFLKIKENPIDFYSETRDVIGDINLMVEFGSGYILVGDSSKWFFKYINVWQLQDDGSYKLKIDMYNN